MSSCSENSSSSEAPPTPTLIEPADGAVAQPTDITLSWSASGTPGYLLYFDDVNPPNAAAIEIDDAPNFSAMNLSQSRTYYWRVIAVNAKNVQSLSSAVWRFSTGSFEYGWSELAAMPTERLGVASAVANGRLYIFGGTTLGGFSAVVEVYDPVPASWTTLAPLSSNRSYACAVAVQGKIHVIGGISSNIPQVLHEVYDPSSDSWETRAPLPAPRSRYAAEAVNGRIYVFGDYGGEKDIIAYDVSGDSWQKVGELPKKRDGLSATYFNGLFYLIGGSEPDNFWLTDVTTFDPISGQLSQRASMPSARRDHRTSLVGNKIYVTGGLNAIAAHLFFASVEVYDPAIDHWITRSRMKFPRHDHGVGVISGKIYVAGGLTEHEPNIIKSLEVYDPLLDQ